MCCRYTCGSTTTLSPSLPRNLINCAALVGWPGLRACAAAHRLVQAGCASCRGPCVRLALRTCLNSRTRPLPSFMRTITLQGGGGGVARGWRACVQGQRFGECTQRANASAHHAPLGPCLPHNEVLLRAGVGKMQLARSCGGSTGHGRGVCAAPRAQGSGTSMGRTVCSSAAPSSAAAARPSTCHQLPGAALAIRAHDVQGGLLWPRAIAPVCSEAGAPRRCVASAASAGR